MKIRLLVAFVSLIVVAGIVTYILIPSPLIVSDTTGFHTSTNGAYRTLIRQDIWNKFAPEIFTVKKRLANTIELEVSNNGKQIPVSILLIPKSVDSLNLFWKSTFPVTHNPFAKIRQYSRATALHEKMDGALQKFRSYVSETSNVYGASIIETSTKDTFLITTRFETKSAPTNEVIYQNISKLQTFASQTGVNQAGAPMLNISTADSINFNCMVAIPIDKIVDSKGDIAFVRMIPGRFLTTDVQGGPYNIRAAHKMMDQYFKDFNRIAMAIRFEYLITNRLQEPDTTKWSTKIYCPVY